MTPETCTRCGSTDLISERKPKFHREIDLPEVCCIVRESENIDLSSVVVSNVASTSKQNSPKESPAQSWAPASQRCLQDGPINSPDHLENSETYVAQLTGYRFSSATILACQQRVSAALKESYEMVTTACRSEPWVGADETPWPTHGQRRYCWLASGDTSTLIKLFPRRNRASSQKLLGETNQPLVSDRYSAYSPTGAHQYCLAHWKRDIEGLPSTALELQESLGIDLDAVFDHWRRYQAGELSRPQWHRLTAYRREGIMKSLLFWSRASPFQEIRRRCDSWLKHYDRFWTFLHVPLEPTNNRTEREIRPLVVRRKICGGTRSNAGERFIERLYSLGATLHKRGADLTGYLIDALRAHWANQPAPLLPQPCVYETSQITYAHLIVS